ncbi:MAG TPA: DUF4112 domain-containing protein [Blastocatellia bacterium]|jgi:hypothetical protein|nr:DUF4112 domain-containing protein [Blastocatellia bacterium]
MPAAPGVAREPIDKNLDRLSYILDRSIRVPGTDLRFGVDPIISFLFPFAGDTIGALLSAYIVLVSVRYGLPKGVIARMVFNVGADFAIGSIPFVGDLFDFAWKSNDKNMKLLEKHARGKGGSFWSDWAWVAILLGIVILAIFGLFAVIIYAVGNIDLGAPFGRASR